MTGRRFPKGVGLAIPCLSTRGWFVAAPLDSPKDDGGAAARPRNVPDVQFMPRSAVWNASCTSAFHRWADIPSQPPRSTCAASPNASKARRGRCLTRHRDTLRESSKLSSNSVSLSICYRVRLFCPDRIAYHHPGIGVHLVIAFLLPSACPFQTVSLCWLAYPYPTASHHRPWCYLQVAENHVGGSRLSMVVRQRKPERGLGHGWEVRLTGRFG